MLLYAVEGIGAYASLRSATRTCGTDMRQFRLQVLPSIPFIRNFEYKTWSEWRESNPRSCLGKAEHYHYATLAC